MDNRLITYNESENTENNLEDQMRDFCCPECGHVTDYMGHEYDIDEETGERMVTTDCYKCSRCGEEQYITVIE